MVTIWAPPSQYLSWFSTLFLKSFQNSFHAGLYFWPLKEDKRPPNWFISFALFTCPTLRSVHRELRSSYRLGWVFFTALIMKQCLQGIRPGIPFPRIYLRAKSAEAAKNTQCTGKEHSSEVISAKVCPTHLDSQTTGNQITVAREHTFLHG